MDADIIFLGDIFEGLGSNFFCIIFFIIALNRARAHKSPWIKFTFGIILQIFSFAVMITEKVQSTEIELTNKDVFSVGFFLIFVVIETILLNSKKFRIVKLEEHEVKEQTK